MTIAEMKVELEKNLKPRRYIHSLNVMNEAIRLSQIYGGDSEKAAVAGLLHDCARDISDEKVLVLCMEFDMNIDEVSMNQTVLLHGPLGAHIAKSRYEVYDEEILNAIRYHTTGHSGMNLLEKIVFLADYIEPDRVFTGVEGIRKLASEDIDCAILSAMDSTIEYILKQNALLHINTINARNYILRLSEK